MTYVPGFGWLPSETAKTVLSMTDSQGRKLEDGYQKMLDSENASLDASDRRMSRLAALFAQKGIS